MVLSWTAPADDYDVLVTRYVVTAYGGAGWSATMTVSDDPLSTTATFTGLTNGSPYTFTVIAHNAAGAATESAASNPVTPVGMCVWVLWGC